HLGCSPDQFHNWPMLEKDLVASRPDDFVSDQFRPDELMTLRTSGTTGTPLQVRISKAYHQMEMAFRWRHKSWGGVPFLSRAAYISGHPIVPASQSTPPFWRTDHIEKRLLCSSYHLAAVNLTAYVDALRKYNPNFIHGYPSSVYLVAQCILDQDIQD